MSVEPHVHGLHCLVPDTSNIRHLLLYRKVQLSAASNIYESGATIRLAHCPHCLRGDTVNSKLGAHKKGTCSYVGHVCLYPMNSDGQLRPPLFYVKSSLQFYLKTTHKVSEKDVQI